jgi:hypothetical protein
VCNMDAVNSHAVIDLSLYCAKVNLLVGAT